ncbi:hypothetical protein JIR23_20255 [Bradyrhizobium diazoefficiens]|nr:hypothetical protein [Bradyrhizobium diazoefficiens]QQN61942.1 hypothetical protein JIR23_20255 [Bradyrhizobium diazoefficiens]
MPQIWLTYDELAALVDCDPAMVRGTASAMPLDRRKSRDGQTRVKLDAALTKMFLDAASKQRIERDIATSVSDLRTMHERMAERSVATADFPLRANGQDEPRLISRLGRSRNGAATARPEHRQQSTLSKRTVFDINRFMMSKFVEINVAKNKPGQSIVNFSASPSALPGPRS